METTKNEAKLAEAIEKGHDGNYKVFKIPSWLAAKKSDKSKRFFESKYPKGVPMAGKVEDETEDALEISSVATLKIEKRTWNSQQIIQDVIKEVENGEHTAFSYSDFPSKTWMPKSEMEVIE